MHLGVFWIPAAGVAALAAAIAFVWIKAAPAPRAAPSPEQRIVIPRSAEAESERKATIDSLIAGGLVRPIDPPRSGTLRVSLRPTFFTLDEEKRRVYVDVIYRHYFDGSSVNDTIVLRDAQHGNKVGEYNPYQGGLKMYR